MQLKKIIARAVLVAGLAFAGNWNIDPTTAKVNFSIKGPFGTVHGNFSGLKADIRFNAKDLSGSSISASVEAKTVNTGNGLRNHDLRSKEEWFNSDKFPQISFHSKKIEGTGTSYKAIGELTIKGLTKPAEISFTFTDQGGSGIFKGQLSVKREEFNLGKPGGSVGAVVTIDLEVPVKHE